MKEGVIQQIADPVRLYESPANKFVAGFIGSPPVNFLRGKLIPKASDLYFVDAGVRLKVLKQHHERLAPYLNRDVFLGIRPEDVYDKLFAQDASEEFMITATVDLVEPMGSEIYLYFSVGRNNFIVRVSNQDTAKPNQDLQLVFDMSKAHFFDPVTEQAVI